MPSERWSVTATEQLLLRLSFKMVHERRSRAQPPPPAPALSTERPCVPRTPGSAVTLAGVALPPPPVSYCVTSGYLLPPCRQLPGVFSSLPVRLPGRWGGAGRDMVWPWRSRPRSGPEYPGVSDGPRWGWGEGAALGPASQVALSAPPSVGGLGWASRDGVGGVPAGGDCGGRPFPHRDLHVLSFLLRQPRRSAPSIHGDLTPGLFCACVFCRGSFCFHWIFLEFLTSGVHSWSRGRGAPGRCSPASGPCWKHTYTAPRGQETGQQDPRSRHWPRWVACTVSRSGEFAALFLAFFSQN